MSRFVYKEDHLNEISFPLGGIGTGSVGISGTGRFVDWEIFNKPNKRSLNGFTHFAIKVEENGKVLDSRVMNSDLPPPYMGSEFGRGAKGNYGFGPDRYLLAGVPHFHSAVFSGEYPFARIDFQDETFPGTVALTAFNPLIPLNDKDSSLPVAMFMPEITNTGNVSRDYVVAFTVNNPLRKGQRCNRHLRQGHLHLVELASTCADEDDPDYGSLAVSVENDRAAWQENWYLGAWYDNLGIFWQDFTSPGDLKNRVYTSDELPEDGGESTATLTARITLAPGESVQLRFALAWSFPNMYNYWNPVTKNDQCCSDGCCCDDQPSGAGEPTWKNYYATLFADARETIVYIHREWQRLLDETLRFKTILYRSSMPEEALEALVSNISLLRGPTCLRLTDGSFYGFEGCHCDAGCCEGSCTHVWNYAYALPYLFPKLERSMRELDFKYNLRAAGDMAFRLQLPLGREQWKFRACVDGQMGGIIKMYREWQICGDTEWLRQYWPQVKKSLEFAWSPENGDRWDPEKKGYMEGRQHHTLDMELFGPNAWLSGFYLAALAAGQRMAQVVGDDASAQLYGEIFTRGKKWVDANLFNGEYFYQKLDLDDQSILAGYSDDSLIGQSLLQAYWNSEAGEIKYQIGEGSSIDQVLAQWHCDLIGLGDIFDRAKVRSALSSIYKYNYKPSFRQHFNPCRIYCLNDEAGTTICAWPEGKRKPVVPAPYSEETMHGFEYQAGIHMIINGLEKEGLEVVKAVRDRYDGKKRNPWNEFECGSDYARSMATYALLPAYSGFISEMSRRHLTFNPLHAGDEVQFFWSVDSAWGEIRFRETGIELEVISGKLQLESISLPETEKIVDVIISGKPQNYEIQNGEIRFARQLEITEGNVLTCEK